MAASRDTSLCSWRDCMPPRLPDQRGGNDQMAVSTSSSVTVRGGVSVSSGGGGRTSSSVAYCVRMFAAQGKHSSWWSVVTRHFRRLEIGVAGGENAEGGLDVAVCAFGTDTARESIVVCCWGMEREGVLSAAATCCRIWVAAVRRGPSPLVASWARRTTQVREGNLDNDTGSEVRRASSSLWYREFAINRADRLWDPCQYLGAGSRLARPSGMLQARAWGRRQLGCVVVDGRATQARAAVPHWKVARLGGLQFGTRGVPPLTAAAVNDAGFPGALAGASCARELGCVKDRGWWRYKDHRDGSGCSRGV